MTFISITRLRVRSIRYLPLFAIHTYRALSQAKAASGFLGGGLLPDRDWTFWTMTAWDGEQSMRSFMMAGSHRAAMPKLMEWCDEASVVHWEQAEAALPSWTEADRRMRANGRASRVTQPSAQHTSMTYRTPRVSRAVAIRPANR